MTNLFLNNSRYIAMDHRQQINPALTKANKTENLSKIKPVFFQYFEPLVDNCCRRIDVEFGLQLGKNREKLSKDQYIKLLEYLRSVRTNIEQSYLLAINDIFYESFQKTANDRNKQLDFSKISLLNNDEVKENHVVTQIIRQCEHLFYEELTSLNKHFALQQGKQTIADSQNPIFPEKLVRALVEVVKPLKLNMNGRIALYKTFEVNVFTQMGFMYRELIKWCETTGPAPLYGVGGIKEQAEPVSADIEQPSAAFALLQEKLEQWRVAHSPSAYDLISIAGDVFYQHFEIKNALQILQQFSDDTDSAEKKLPLKWRVLKKLEELRFNNKPRNLAKHDEDTLDLSALIFGEIERDGLLQDAVKAAILQLEMPLAAASLGQYSIFTHQDNPVRQLLDDLYAAGIFLNTGEFDERLIQERIANAVKKMTQDSGYEFSAWVAEAGEFSAYLTKQKQRSRNIEENTKQFMNDKQVLASSRKIIAITIENSMKGKPLPTAIAEFLRDVWSNVLLHAFTVKNEQPERWEKSVRAMDELIISVMPFADDNERKRILKFLPGLIAELRNGLKQISYDKSAQSRFFKDLAVWHIILMDKKGKTPSDKDSAVPVEDKTTKAEAIADDSMAQAGNLALESWVAFMSDSGRQWGKLLWKDVAAENMLFIGKNGIKMFEMQATELAEKLRLGQAAIVNVSEKTLTDRVLSALMNL